VRRIFAGLSIVLTSLALLVLIGEFSERLAQAASLQLAWLDNSTDEEGFNIERSLVSGGPYASVGTVGPNVTTYTDTNLLNGTTYCYRVNAFNSAGPSPYSPEICGMTAVATFNLSVSSAGTGSGTVTSSPAGINCGSTCSANYNSGTAVTLTATAASGSTFAGWSGTGCTTGSVTMNTATSCTANFTANPMTFTLTISAIGTMTVGGTGQGTVVSTPSGINCGTQCSASFQSGAMVALQAIPGAGSIFAGWSGDGDCSDGSVTMNATKSCTATFQPISYSLTISLAGTGTGKVTANVAAINCGTNCFAQFSKVTTVTLTPLPSADSTFIGWSGNSDCLDGSVTVNSNISCTATFIKRPVSNIGIFRPSAGAWYLINNNTGTWQGCNVDLCFGTFGQNGDQAIAGDWNGTGRTKIGVYDPAGNSWELDDGDGTWEGCSSDTCLSFSALKASSSDEIAVVGSWNGSGKDFIGMYSGAGYWYLDANGNGKWDGCSRDKCFGPFGGPGDVPVVGDWSGNQIDKIGTFDPATGQWQLDMNGNGKWDGCKKDKCLGPFGTTGDIPVVGDWNGTGTARIAIFRPATGEWFLDLNGNGKWDGANVDKYIRGFGHSGDTPVVGIW
jgi:hypothetical protein